MLSLIYMSSATTPFLENELIELLIQSRANNDRLNVSGMLLYHDGNFLQVLEGPDEAVLALFDRIAQDPRHSGVTRLLQRAIGVREFGQWSMAFRSPEYLKAYEIAGFSRFLNSPFSDYFSGNPSYAHSILLSFRDMMR